MATCLRRAVRCELAVDICIPPKLAANRQPRRCSHVRLHLQLLLRMLVWAGHGSWRLHTLRQGFPSHPCLKKPPRNAWHAHYRWEARFRRSEPATQQRRDCGQPKRAWSPRRRGRAGAGAEGGCEGRAEAAGRSGGQAARPDRKDRCRGDEAERSRACCLRHSSACFPSRYVVRFVVRGGRPAKRSRGC